MTFILTTSTEIVESKFPKLGYLRLKSTTADQPQSGPVREQHLTVGIIMRIEMHQAILNKVGFIHYVTVLQMVFS